jgi:hypothetical protein
MNFATVNAAARHFIASEWITGSSETRQSFDPATGEALGE